MKSGDIALFARELPIVPPILLSSRSLSDFPV